MDNANPQIIPNSILASNFTSLSAAEPLPELPEGGRITLLAFSRQGHQHAHSLAPGGYSGTICWMTDRTN